MFIGGCGKSQSKICNSQTNIIVSCVSAETLAETMVARVLVLRSEGLGKEESEDKEQGHGAAAASKIDSQRKVL